MRRLNRTLKTLTLALGGLTALSATGCKTTQEKPDQVQAEAPSAAAPEDSFRAQPPTPGQPPELVLPTFEKAHLKNGLTVLVSRRAGLPLVTLDVTCASGSAADSRGKGGLADLSFRMLLEGAGTRDAIALDDAFADLGVSPSVSVGADGSFVGVTVLSRNVEPAMKLLADVVLRPKLQAKDFERRKQQQLADLAQRIGNPRFLAQVASAEAIFGASHPYGHPGSGTPVTVEAISLADVKGYLAEHLGPKACAFVAAGDLTLAEATALAEKHLGNWSGKAMPSPAPGAPKLAPRTQVVLVPKPGLNQTLVIMGRPGVASGNPMEAPLELASTVFGGFFGSRLNMNLREAKGYTYGAGAGLDARKGPGPVTASSSVRADVTGPAVQEFYGELKGLKTRPITSEELEPAREGVIRSIPGGFDTVEGLAGTASAIFFKDMPLDRLQQIVSHLESADVASVQSAGESFFEPEYLRIVLVGDPALIREQVTPLNLGTIVEQAPPAMPKKH